MNHITGSSPSVLRSRFETHEEPLKQNHFENHLKLFRDRQWIVIKEKKVADLIKIKNVYQRTLLMQLSMEGDEVIQEILTWKQIDYNNAIDKDGNTALHLAAKEGMSHLIPRLAASISIHSQNLEKETPLQVAIRAGQKKSVKALIHQGASLHDPWNYIDHHHKYNFDCLMLAAHLKQMHCMDVMIDLNAPHPLPSYQEQGTFLHALITINAHHAVHHLFKHHYPLAISLIEAKNSLGQTPLCYAAKLQNMKMLYLLWRYGASLNETDQASKNALAYASEEKNSLLIELITTLQGTRSTLENLTLNDQNKGALNITAQVVQSLPVIQEFFLAGYGTKWIAFIGALMALEEKQGFLRIQAFSGVGFGAIIATLLALGYTLHELKSIVSDFAILQYIDFEEMDLKDIKKTCEMVNHLKNDKNFPATYPRALCQAKKLHQWLEELIFKKTQVKFLTFNELSKLVKTSPHFKHLSIWISAFNAPHRLLKIHSKNPSKHYGNAVISDTLVAAVAVPGFIDPCKIRTKGLNQPLDYLKTDNKKDMKLFISSQNYEEEISHLNDHVLKCILTEDYKKIKKFNSSLEALDRIFSHFNLSSVGSGLSIRVDLYESTSLFIHEEDRDKLIQHSYHLMMQSLDSFHCLGNISPLDLSIPVRKIIFPALVKTLPLCLKNTTKRFVEPFTQLKQSIFALDKPESILPLVIYDHAGEAASQLVNEFAHTFYSKFSFIAWIDCETPSTRLFYYRSLARRLKLPFQSDEMTLKQSINQALEDIQSEKPWLLIFDRWNEVIPPLTPNQGGHVILIAEDNGWKDKATIRLEKFSEKNFSEAIITQLKNETPEGYNLLKILVFFKFDALNVLIVQAWMKKKKQRHGHQAKDLLKELKKFMDVVDFENQFKIPRTYQKLIQGFFKEKKLEKYYRQALEVFHTYSELCFKKSSVTTPEEKNQFYLHWMYFQTHPLWITLKNPKELSLIFSIHFQLAQWLLLSEKDVDQALRLANQCMETTQEIQEVDEKNVEAFKLLGCCYYAKKDWAHALLKFQEGLKLALIHNYLTLTAELTHEIAKCHYQLHDDKLAIENAKKFLALIHQPHPLRAASYDILGNCYLHARQYKQSLESYRQALKSHENYPNENLNIHFLKYHMAYDLYKEGNYKQALMICHQLYHFHENSDYQLELLSLMSKIYCELENPEKALKTIRKAQHLANQTKLEKNHPLHFRLILDEIQTLLRAGDSKAALALIIIRSHEIENANPELRAEWFSLKAEYYWKSDSPIKALEFYQQSINLYPNHLIAEKALTSSAMGLLNAYQGSFIQGLTICENALESLGKEEESLERADILFDCAKIKYLKKTFEDALIDLDKSYHIRKNKLGDYHSKTLLVQSLRGLCLNQMNQTRGTLICEQALAALRQIFPTKMYPKSTAELIEGLMNLGECYFNQQKYKESLQEFFNAYSLAIHFYSNQEHLTLAWIKYKMAQCHERKEDIQRSHTQFSELLNFTEDHLSKDHYLRGFAWLQLGLLHSKINPELQSESLYAFAKAEEIFKKRADYAMFLKELHQLKSESVNPLHRSNPSRHSLEVQDTLKLADPQAINLRVFLKKEIEGDVYEVEIDPQTLDFQIFIIKEEKRILQSSLTLKFSRTIKKFNLEERLFFFFSSSVQLENNLQNTSQFFLSMNPHPKGSVLARIRLMGLLNSHPTKEFNIVLFPGRLHQSQAWIQTSDQSPLSVRLDLSKLVFLNPSSFIHLISTAFSSLKIKGGNEKDEEVIKIFPPFPSVYEISTPEQLLKLLLLYPKKSYLIQKVHLLFEDLLKSSRLSIKQLEALSPLSIFLEAELLRRVWVKVAELEKEVLNVKDSFKSYCKCLIQLKKGGLGLEAHKLYSSESIIKILQDLTHKLSTSKMKGERDFLLELLMNLMEIAVSIDEGHLSKTALNFSKVLKKYQNNLSEPENAFASTYALHLLNLTQSKSFIVLQELNPNHPVSLLTIDLKNSFKDLKNVPEWFWSLLALRLKIMHNIQSVREFSTVLTKPSPSYLLMIGLVQCVKEVLTLPSLEIEIFEDALCNLKKILDHNQSLQIKESNFRISEEKGRQAFCVFLTNIIHEISSPPQLAEAVSGIQQETLNINFPPLFLSPERQLAHHQQKQLTSDYSFQQSLAIAFPLDGELHVGHDTIPYQSLSEALEAFMWSEDKIFLLSGGPHSGKTSSIKKFIWDELKKYNPESHDYLPLYIPMSRLKNPIKNLQDEYLDSVGIDKNAREELTKSHLIWVCDEFKELFSQERVEFRNLYLTNNGKKWENSKWVFISEPNFCDLDYFHIDDSNLWHFVIQTISEEKIQNLLEKDLQLSQETSSEFNLPLLKKSPLALSILRDNSETFNAPIIQKKYPLSYRIADIPKIKRVLSLSLDEHDADFRFKCFDHILHLCIDQQWKTIREILPYLYNLRNSQGASLFQALMENSQVDSLISILKLNHEDILSSGDFKFPLHRAIVSGNAQFFNLLLPFIELEKKDEQDKSPLFLAIEQERLDFVIELLKKGASLKTLCKIKKHTLSPFSWAIARGSLEIVEALINTNQVNWQEEVDDIGSLLHLTIYFNRVSILRYLLNKKFDKTEPLLEKPNNQGMTPFNYAAFLGNQMVLFLLKNKNINPLSADRNHYTAIQNATLNGHAHCLEFLMSLSKEPPSPLIMSALALAPNEKIKKILLKKSLKKDLKLNTFLHPYQLVLQGTHLKCLMTSIDSLEKEKKLNKLQRVAGSSKGALAALSVALELDKKLKEDLFSLEALLDSLLTSEVINKNQRVISHLKKLWELINWKLSKPSFIKSQSNETNNIEFLYRLVLQSCGTLDISFLYEKVDRIIKEVTGISHCTFGQLKNCITEGKSFSHLYIYGLKLGTQHELLCFNSENDQWKNFSIAQALLISLSIPGLMIPYLQATDSCKFEEIYTGLPFVTDSIVEQFDSFSYFKNTNLQLISPLYNPRTLGLSVFQTQENPLMIQGEIFKHSCFNQSRVIEIPIKNIQEEESMIKLAEERTAALLSTSLQTSIHEFQDLNIHERNLEALTGMIASPLFSSLESSVQAPLLFKLAEIRFQLKDFSEALTVYRRCLKVLENDQTSSSKAMKEKIAQAIQAIGEDAFNKSEFEVARDLYRESLAIFSSLIIKTKITELNQRMSQLEVYLGWHQVKK